MGPLCRIAAVQNTNCHCDAEANSGREGPRTAYKLSSAWKPPGEHAAVIQYEPIAAPCPRCRPRPSPPARSRPWCTMARARTAARSVALDGAVAYPLARFAVGAALCPGPAVQQPRGPRGVAGGARAAARSAASTQHYTHISLWARAGTGRDELATRTHPRCLRLKDRAKGHPREPIRAPSGLAES